MKSRLIFNPSGLDDLKHRDIINGNITNLIQLNSVKYNWANTLYNKMRENFWIPEKVDLSMENLLYQNLTDSERKAYKLTLGFLIFLDSIQVTNLPNVNRFITAPEVIRLLAEQTSQEALHNTAYQYILESVVDYEDREEIYNIWKTDAQLSKRFEYIADIYQQFDNTNEEFEFVKVLIGNYILEGLYFYMSFNFFYNLSSRSLMVGTADEIKYINIDEKLHVVIFERIINELSFISNYKDIIYKMFDKAVQDETNWSVYCYGDILGFNPSSIEIYLKHRANGLLKKIGLDILYEGDEYLENPYAYLEKLSDVNKQGHTRSNFFETTVTNYVVPEYLDGWDEI